MALVLQHVPPPHQKLVNFYGLYSNAHRGKRKKQGHRFGRPEVKEAPWEPPELKRRWGSSSWRYLIWRAWLEDPMLCPECGTKLKISEIVTSNAPRRYRALKQLRLFPVKQPRGP